MKLLIILFAAYFVGITLATRGPPPRPQQPHRKNGNGWGHGSGNNGWNSGNSGLGWEDNTVPSYETPPSCLDRSKIPVQNHYDSDFFQRFRLWYISGASKYEYITTALKCLGRLPKNQRELSEMCLTEMYGEPDIVINNCYGRQYSQNCTTSELDSSHERCVILEHPKTYDGKLGVKPNLGDEVQTVYLVKTDSYSYAIYYICSDGQFAHLQLATTRPYVHPNVVSTYLDLAENLGFHTSEMQLLFCRAPHFQHPYPFPFQNYPHSPGNEQSHGGGWIQEKPTSGWGEESYGWEPHSDGWGWGQNSNSNGWAPNDNGWGQNSSGGGWGQSNSGGWGQGNGSGWQGIKEADPPMEKVSE